jgi:two-component system OmpR family sensor kinase
VGRLFWKVFAFTLLAQLIATFGIGGAIWLKRAANEVPSEQIDRSPPAAFMIEAAASTLQYGGVVALRSLLANLDQHRSLVAVGEDNQELLGRTLNPQMLATARNLLQSNMAHGMVRQVQAPDGHRYLLFVPMSAGDRHGFDGAGRAPLAASGFFLDQRPPPFDAHEPGHEGVGPPPDGPHGGPNDHPPDMPSDMHFLPFLPIISAIFGSLIFALMLAWYFSKPIRSLRSAFTSVAGGDLEIHLCSVIGPRRDELADLGRDFDAMVERLRALMNGQRRLLHDVSHELRSPLARLQVAIGLARQQPEKIDSSLERIERESMRMEKLVGELLTLSKLEAGALQPVHEDINVDELLADLVLDARFEAEASGLKLEFPGHCDLILKGDGELLHRALENVLRNALKHTMAGSNVTLEAGLDAQRKELRIAILDRGPGVAQAELDLIFEPFFRGTGAAQNTEGHGLGLAIAQRVVAAHGGSIHATNRNGGGLVIEIFLPLQP